MKGRLAPDRVGQSKTSHAAVLAPCQQHWLHQAGAQGDLMSWSEYLSSQNSLYWCPDQEDFILSGISHQQCSYGFNVTMVWVNQSQPKVNSPFASLVPKQALVWLDGEPRHFWIDTNCLNQENNQ